MRTADIAMFSDFTCPWCYITKRRLEAAIRSLPASITASVSWRPLAAVRGLARDPSAERFLTRLGASEGIAFAFDRIAAMPDTLDAHRLVYLAQDTELPEGTVGRLVEGMYRAHFSDGRDIGSRETLGAVAGEAGLDPSLVSSWLAGNEGTNHVLDLERRALAVGIDTIPFLLINGQVGIRGSRSTAHLLERIQGASWFGLDRASRLAIRDRRHAGIAPARERREVEALIDDILDDTFPASDAPAWGAPAKRIRRVRRKV
jgi:predicted DsbA family dithiol-disulfide isomerase